MTDTPFKPLALPTRWGVRKFFNVWFFLVLLCLAILVATYLFFVEPAPPRHLVIATGSKEGAYYHYATRYAELLRKYDLRLEVKATQGSVENLQLLEDDSAGVSVAIVQSGVAPARNGGPAGAEAEGKLRALGSLYREPLWVFYRGPAALDSLGPLAGKKLAIGPDGSGTRAIALQMLQANGLRGKGAGDANLLASSGNAAADALRRGEIDAAFFVASIDADYIRGLFAAEEVRLLNFSQQSAYQRRYRFLSGVTIPAGLIDLGQNLPAQDTRLIAPTATLVARKDLHPALISLLLQVATKVHAEGDLVSNPGEFPTPLFTDLPLSESAHHYYKSGTPWLQAILPFWLASLVDRLKVMIIPLVVLMMPLIRMAPPLVRWRTRRKIYRWYALLRDIDQKLSAGMAPDELRVEVERLREVEGQLTHVEVPLGYMEEFYNMRLHLQLVQNKLERLLTEKASAMPPSPLPV
jgi:uncharacterized protein